MCTRFVCRANAMITGFNFDIDLAVWDHQLIMDHDHFAIGILRPDGLRHTYHGVHRNGNVGTLLYVHGVPGGLYTDGVDCMTIADLTEQFVQARLSFDDAVHLVQTKKITYAADATMQAMPSDRHGRTLIIEPGIGYRVDSGRFSLITNYSLLDPESTRPFIVPGDDRNERANATLSSCNETFNVSDAFSLLRNVRQEGPWATRVSFVYAAHENTVYYVQNNRFDDIQQHHFPLS